LKTYENDPHTSLYISSFQGESVRLGQHIVCHLRTTYTVATSQYWLLIWRYGRFWQFANPWLTPLLNTWSSSLGDNHVLWWGCKASSAYITEAKM